jgi:DNA-binding PucR family transcriptional regulator
VATSACTAELTAQVAQALLAQGDALADELDAAVFEASPVLARDATIAADTSASNRAHLRRWLGAMARHPGEPVSSDVPPEALDIARSVVRRGVEPEALIHAYRRGQNLSWRRWMETAAATIPDKGELIEVLEDSSAAMFAYTDVMLDSVLAEAQREREELLGGALARRTETVRLILDGAPIDERRASRQLGHELARRHTAIVLWAEPQADVQGALEQAATALAHAAGAHRPLTMPAGTSALWAWIGTDRDPEPAVLREAITSATPNIRAAVGTTLPGITGFRRSHATALATQDLVAGNRLASRVTTYRDVEIVALAARDRDQTNEFIASTLGPLAADDAQAARLRETLRAYLHGGSRAPRAAHRLNTHRNTILHRVARAEELLGHSVEEHRLALALALELAHWLGVGRAAGLATAAQERPLASSARATAARTSSR